LGVFVLFVFIRRMEGCEMEKTFYLDGMQSAENSCFWLSRLMGLSLYFCIR
jgi:hypothetical protein